MDVNSLSHPTICALPKKEQRFWVELTIPAGDKRAKAWDSEACDWSATSADLSVTVDPSEFLDFVTPAELIEAGNEHAFWSGIEENERLQVLDQLDGVCSYDVDELLAEIAAAIDQGRGQDALDAIRAYQHPKFKTTAACEAAYNLAMEF